VRKNNFFLDLIKMNYDKCFIIGHLSLNDLFIINGIIHYYSKLYNTVYIACKKKNYKSIFHCFFNNDLIIPIIIDTTENVLNENHLIFKQNKNLDIIKIGIHNENWNKFKSDLIIGNFPYSYFKTFYEQLGLDYEIRYNYEDIYRNEIIEKKFYNKCMQNYDKYKFVYGIKEDDLINDEIPIFHPYKNYYEKSSKFYNYWNNIISDNIFDYCKIIEKSTEIHLSYSKFLSLSLFLNLDNIKEKNLYTNITNIKDLHKKLDSWNIIYSII